MNLPEVVTIVEVGPRDGFQTESTWIPTELKVQVIEAVAAAGVSKVEATSFVSPKVVPQMRDAEAVFRSLRRQPGTRYTALVPNLKGAERAAEAGADGVRFVVAATETYNRRNVGMSVEDSLATCGRIVEALAGSGVGVEAVIGLAFGCPFEGPVPAGRVVELARRFADMGIRELSVADSVGLADPAQVQRVMQSLMGQLPDVEFSLHLHNTRGLGLANALAAMDVGVTTFDASVGGLGGCPVYQGAAGNIPTEDLANMCDSMGIRTGIDVERLLDVARSLQEFLGRRLPSHVLTAGTAKQLYATLRGEPS